MEDPWKAEIDGVQTSVHATRERAVEWATRRLVEQIANARRSHPPRRSVLGLATGQTPIPIYAELVRRHRAGLSFRDVVTFNLDEYYPIVPTAAGSFRRFMADHLTDHVDLHPEDVHVPDGSIPPNRIAEGCDEYERALRLAGGVDLQLLGIGANGHIGFNEPGSPADSRTRLVALHPKTRADNAHAFPSPDDVPAQAITMGIGTILEARAILVVAFGPKKAEAVGRSLLGPIDDAVPASLLRRHPNVEFVLDPESARRLLHRRENRSAEHP